ncbi:MAG TPA: DUF6600 domain-containing protein [Candidatus Acidoferrales bacterium]
MSVFKGAASVTTPQAPAGSQTSAVEQGHMLSFHSDNTQALEITELPAEDQFDAYVAYNNAVMMENVSNELNYIAPGAPYTYSYALSELTRYGTWFNFPGYGWGWQPTVVNSEWVPFSNGIWRFAPHFGYCFVSFDRWGWLPFHFGNWVHAPQGWAWIPGSSKQWQPAVVGWVRVGNQVGWVPRAPGDQPNKLPGNVKYGVVTNPLETTTTVLRGPNNILRSEAVKNARVIPGPTNRVVATTTAKSVAPFVVQPPMSRTPPFTAPVARTNSPVAGGSRAIVFDPATRTYVNANPRVQPAGDAAARAASSSPARVPRVGVPIGSVPVNRMPVNGMPGNGMYRPMPTVPGGAQPSVMRGNAGARFPVGEPRLASPGRVSPLPQAPSMPRPMPQTMPAPMHAQPASRAPGASPGGPAGHPAGSAAGAGNAAPVGNGHR